MEGYSDYFCDTLLLFRTLPAVELRLVSKRERLRARVAEGGLLFYGFPLIDCFPLTCRGADGAESRAACAWVALIWVLSKSACCLAMMGWLMLGAGCLMRARSGFLCGFACLCLWARILLRSVMHESICDLLAGSCCFLIYQVCRGML